MGVMERLSTLIRANINDMLDQAEDPEIMLNQILRDMETEIGRARSQVADMMAQERIFSDDLKAEQDKGAHMEERAEYYVRQGNDAMAREALKRNSGQSGGRCGRVGRRSLVRYKIADCSSDPKPFCASARGAQRRVVPAGSRAPARQDFAPRLRESQSCSGPDAAASCYPHQLGGCTTYANVPHQGGICSTWRSSPWHSLTLE